MVFVEISTTTGLLLSISSWVLINPNHNAEEQSQSQKNK